jgi:hypothetical protein
MDSVFDPEKRNDDFSKLIGLKVLSVDGMEDGSGEVKMLLESPSGRRYRMLMYHPQDCCENVRIIDVCGDVSDLVGEVIYGAEEVAQAPDPDPAPVDAYDQSHQWTFYHLRTRKGTMTLRWLGESNGWYGVGVDVYIRAL